jgi:hypothetical protein
MFLQIFSKIFHHLKQTTRRQKSKMMALELNKLKQYKASLLGRGLYNIAIAIFPSFSVFRQKRLHLRYHLTNRHLISKETTEERTRS